MSIKSEWALNTERLCLRHAVIQDASFILRLVNDDDWLRYIGDRGVSTLAGAEQFIVNGPHAMLKEHGHCMLVVIDKSTQEAVGLCGLLKRPELSKPDLGFAFLPEGRGAGFAKEASLAILEHAKSILGISSVFALTALDNSASIRLLKTLGFLYQHTIDFPNKGELSKLFCLDL